MRFIIYERILTERQKIESEITSIKSTLDNLPDGNFLCARNGKNYKWYHLTGHNRTYIYKKNKPLAEQLAYKKYLSLRLKECINEKKAIDSYLSIHAVCDNKSEQLLKNNPEYLKLVSPFFKPQSMELLDWLHSPFQQNPKYPEQLIHKTISGNMVRSKSEALIDMLLHINKIPFRYECALNLDTITIYPDFTIRHPQTGETFYWEHFGLMDDPNYCKNACSKLQLYASNGIIPSIHLITTYETNTHPLSSDTIDGIIRNYFLS